MSLRRKRRPPPTEDRSSIGNVLVQLGLVSREQLDEALRRQAERAPLGSILVEMGALTPAQLEHALAHQALLRGERGAAGRVLAAQTNGLREAAKDFAELARRTEELAKR